MPSPMPYREARGWTILGVVALLGAILGAAMVLLGILVIVAVLVYG